MRKPEWEKQPQRDVVEMVIVWTIKKILGKYPWRGSFLFHRYVGSVLIMN